MAIIKPGNQKNKKINKMIKSKNLNFEPKELKKIVSVAGLISVIIVAFYATGVYRNWLQIRQIKGKPIRGAETKN